MEPKQRKETIGTGCAVIIIIAVVLFAAGAFVGKYWL